MLCGDGFTVLNMFEKIIYKIFIRLKKILEVVDEKEKLKLIVSKNGTRLYPTSRFVNLGKIPKSISLGMNCHIRGELVTWSYSQGITVGDHVFVGEGSRIWSGSKITIGSNVLISHNVNIMDSNGHEIDADLRSEGFKKMLLDGHPNEAGDVKTSPIFIGDGAWICFGSSVMKGVRIGKNAIVSAHSVVINDVEDNCVVGGNPAKLIRRLD